MALPLLVALGGAKLAFLGYAYYRRKNSEHQGSEPTAPPSVGVGMPRGRRMHAGRATDEFGLPDKLEPGDARLSPVSTPPTSI